LSYQRKSEDWSKEFDLNEERKNKNFRSIVEVKKDLIIRAYEALHPASPLKKRYHLLDFIMIWGDFDPRIMSQLVSDPIRNPDNVPNHLAVMGQGVYQEFINQKDFKETNLIVCDEYIGMNPYEPPELVEVYPKGHSLYEESKDRLTKNLPRVIWLPPEEDLPTEFKELLIKKTSQAIEVETLREQKKQEKWELFLEQDDWVRQNGDRYKEYKQEWEADKKTCQTRVANAQIKNTHCAYIVWALDYLKKKWLENGVPIIPTQKIIKEFLLESEDPRVKHRFHPSDWVGQTPAEKKKLKGKWNQPLRAAKRWVYLSAGVNSPRTKKD
jgi:hypothetical protein